MTADIRRSSVQTNIDWLLAVGGSLVLHGMAVAAFIAFADGESEGVTTSTLTVALEWSAPSSEAAATASAMGGAASDAAADTVAASAPRSDRAVAPPEIKPETEMLVAATDSGMRAAPAATAPSRLDASSPPSRVAVAAKPKAVAPRHADTGDNPSAAIEQAAGAPFDELSSDAARDSEVAAASAAPDAGEHHAWSVTSRRPPTYPMGARRRGIEGEVSLRVDVDADGKPQAVTVRRGSGDPQLDAAAARAVELWRFAVATPMTIEIPIVFRLNSSTAEATQP